MASLIERSNPAPEPPYAEVRGEGSDNALRELQHEPPEELARIIAERLEPGERLILSFPVDMNLLGRYAQEWLILTDRRCYVYEGLDSGYELRLPERKVCPTCGRIIRPRIGTCLACMSKRRILLRLLRFVRPHAGLMAVALCLLLVATAISMAPPLISKAVFNLAIVPTAGEAAAPAENFWYRFAEPESVELLLVLGGALLLAFAVPAVLDGVRQFVMGRVGMHVVVDLSNTAFSHMMRLSLSFYHREQTDRGPRRIELKSSHDADRLPGGRIYVRDAEGNAYLIPDYRALDPASRDMIDLFM